MKLKSGFIMHSMGEEHVVVPVDERTKEFHGMIRLNQTGAFLWEHMKEEFTKELLVKALLDTYEVEEAEAKSAVEMFVEKLVSADILEN